MAHRLVHTLVAVSLSAALLAGCAQTPAKPQASLYDRLGGKEAITAVVDTLSANVAADARVNQRFANANIKRFKAQMVDLLCEASGGPCKYKGMDMKTAHTGMKISEAEFMAVAENASKTLDSFKVPAAEKAEVMNLLASMRDDIVNR
ncbi:MAG: putative globin-like protein [bacterium]|jgi:hemoglobin|nr:MAG: putative globin-like protein [bacterium]KAF0150070.1 MAG: putative globin-like protein [bacterium]KAF0169178.1 MAG: putative globin-like protein [bacterium]TXT17186.1 MAG: putative globin-like protein [bacterium]